MEYDEEWLFKDLTASQQKYKNFVYNAIQWTKSEIYRWQNLCVLVVLFTELAMRLMVVRLLFSHKLDFVSLQTENLPQSLP